MDRQTSQCQFCGKTKVSAFADGPHDFSGCPKALEETDARIAALKAQEAYWKSKTNTDAS